MTEKWVKSDDTNETKGNGFRRTAAGRE